MNSAVAERLFGGTPYDAHVLWADREAPDSLLTGHFVARAGAEAHIVIVVGDTHFGSDGEDS